MTLSPSPAAQDAVSMPRVLLIDDDAVQLKLCRIRLEDAGFRVDVAWSGEEAFEAARRSPPDIIVSDVLMGGLDGFGFCRRVRDEPALASVPVLLLSAHYGSEGDQALARQVGAYGLVTRTPEFDAELATVRAALGTSSMQERSALGPSAYELHLRSNADQLTKLLGRARTAEERYRALFQNANDTLTVLTPEGVILDANERWTEVLGVTPQEMIGRHLRDFAAPGRAGEAEAGYRRLMELGSGVVDAVPLARPDGTVVVMEFSNKVFDLEGERTVLAVGRDVTERLAELEVRRQLERELRQAQKMEAIGQLTGGIAHDFNNILGIILANSHFLLDELDEVDPRFEDAHEIKLAAERAAALTRQLLAFSRRQVLEPKVVDLNATVHGLEKMLIRLLGEDLDLSVRTAREAALASVDVGQLEQVILNLVVNARDAMPNGGSLVIETGEAPYDEVVGLGELEPPRHQGVYVVLRVSDTGAGMDATVLRHIFEPFFTTKPPGKGTGLGLATCYGIVKQSGGTIRVESEVGRGTTFEVFLPRVDGGEVFERKPGARATGGPETLLLVEDDPAVRSAVARMLSRLGYQLLVAANGQEAMELAQGHPGSVDAVLCDVVMPGASGPEVVDRLRERFPGLRVLFMSGYTEHAALGAPLLTSSSFLQKPFTPVAIALKLREVLDP